MSDNEKRSTGDNEKRSKSDKKKQAAIIIHGMGEQKPMGTLRSLVQTVWEWDKELHDEQDERNVWWIKPDERAGLHELRRITTGRINAPGCEAHDKRTDFYEFYWADIMQGTTWQHLSGWVSGLMFRWPTRVPRRAMQIWLLLWLFAVTIVLYFLAKLYPLVVSNTSLCGVEAYGCAQWKTLADSLTHLEAVLFPYLWGGLLCWLVLALLRKLFRSENKLDWRIWLTAPIFTAFFALIHPVVMGAVQEIGIFSVALPVLAILFYNSLIGILGDVARYTMLTPDNFEKRHQVRERGLALLNDLHDGGDYDRIVVVAHSLGSIIGYDILSMLWAQRGPKPSNGMPPESEHLFKDMNDWVLKAEDYSDQDKFLSVFRRKQRDIARSLVSPYKPDPDNEEGKSNNWLITDFVTLGAPLTHAEFLMADGDANIRKNIKERIWPVCPPAFEKDDEEEPSFLFRSRGRLFPHHAALFAAVRWSNIYDLHPVFFLGDPFSGPVSRHFGRGVEILSSIGRKPQTIPATGIAEHSVKIKKGRRKSRFFTHTAYWTWPMGVPAGDYVPSHIQTLRDAVNLRDKQDIEV